MIILRRKQQAGFTIVELLIVIVIIGILAAITIVAYNGMQQRANNTKTISAAGQWVKILSMYKVDAGSFPTGDAGVSCLGDGYGKGFSGHEATGPECRADTATTGGITINPNLINLIQPYISGNGPTPAFITAGSSTYPWYRGAYYFYTTPPRVDFVLAGIDTPCEDVGQAGNMTRTTYASSKSVVCHAALE